MAEKIGWQLPPAADENFPPFSVTSPLIESFQRAGQGQVFAFFDQLDSAGQRRLLEEAAEIDLAEVERLTRTLLVRGAASGVNLDGLAPAPYEKRPEHRGDPARWAKAKALGEDAVRAGRGAAFTVGWRAGARLGSDGHGGSVRALERSGALDLMKREGVDTVSYFQVDNPLVRAIDPTFLGWHVLRSSEMSSKMVPKAFPEEKVGHFCVQNGKTIVVE